MSKSACMWLGLGLVLASACAVAQTVTGSGTPGAVPVFTGSSTIGNSPTPIVVDSTNDNVGIGTTTPVAPLHIHGTTGNFQAMTVDTSDSFTNAYIYFPRGTTGAGLVVGNQTEAAGTAYTNASTVRASGGVSQNLALEPGHIGPDNVGMIQIDNTTPASSDVNRPSPAIWIMSNEG